MAHSNLPSLNTDFVEIRRLTDGVGAREPMTCGDSYVYNSIKNGGGPGWGPKSLKLGRWHPRGATGSKLDQGHHRWVGDVPERCSNEVA